MYEIKLVKYLLNVRGINIPLIHFICQEGAVTTRGQVLGCNTVNLQNRFLLSLS